MKKRVLTCLIVFTLLICLVACGEKTEESNTGRNRETNTEEGTGEDLKTDRQSSVSSDPTRKSDKGKDAPDGNSDGSASAGNNASSIDNASVSNNNTPGDNTKTYSDADFGWQTFYDESTDNDGYKISKNIKISGWMKADDTDRIDAAWKVVGKNKIFSATPSEMGFHNGKIYLTTTIATIGTYEWTHNWDEVVYAVGYLELENLTKDYSITKTNTHSLYVNFGTVKYSTTDSMAIDFGNNSAASIKLFYSEPKVLYALQYGGYYAYIHPKMTSDHWGVPFILAFPVDKTPNAPDGDPDPKNCRFIFEGQEFKLPVTWDEESMYDYRNPEGADNDDIKENRLVNTYTMKTDRNQFQFHLEYGFSDERAWVVLDDKRNIINGYTLAMIDSDGNLVYKFDPSDFGVMIGKDEKVVVSATKVQNGYSVLYSSNTTDSSSTNEGFLIIDKYGHEHFNSNDNDEATSYYYIGQYEDKFICFKVESSFSSKTTKMQVIDCDGNIIKDDIAPQKDRSSIHNIMTRLEDTQFLYGNYSLLNTSNWEYIDGNGHINSGLEFDDRYILIDNDVYGHPKAITLDSLKNQETYDYAIKNSAVDIFASLEYGEGKYWDYRDQTYHFVDGEVAVVPQIPDTVKISDEEAYSGGYAFILMAGADGDEYVGVLDENGKLVFEPMKTEGYLHHHGYSNHGYMACAPTNNTYFSYVLTYDGRFLEIGKDDLTEIKDLELHYKHEHEVPIFSGGFFCGYNLQNKKFGFDSKTDFYVSADGKKIISEVYEYERPYYEDVYFDIEQHEDKVKDENRNSTAGLSSIDTFAEIKNRVFGKDVNEAFNAFTDILGVEVPITSGECKSNTNFETNAFLVFDHKQGVNVFGAMFPYYEMDYTKTGTGNYDGRVTAIGFNLTSPDEKSKTRKQAKKAYDKVYKKLYDAYGRPDNNSSDEEKFWVGDFEWSGWNTSDGYIWLCWGSNLWGNEGYNDCFFSLQERLTDADKDNDTTVQE